MHRFYSLLEKIFVVLLVLLGDVSVLLAAREIFVAPEILMVLAVDSRVPLSLSDPHGLAFFGPCLPARYDCWLPELGGDTSTSEINCWLLESG